MKRAHLYLYFRDHVHELCRGARLTNIPRYSPRDLRFLEREAGRALGLQNFFYALRGAPWGGGEE